MINDKELQISNKSYTNKDFPVVYVEILNLIKTITDKWDPATSNESDPGIVLLKLLAFIADKLNYNIDKNLLERFLLSCTQATSMRELCEMMGYEMDYYVSAETKVTFSFSGQEDENGEQKLQGTDYFVIPQFTSVTSANSDVHYITKTDVRIDSSVNYTGTVVAIEGDLNTLTANDSEVIRLENLDDSLRIYFPVPNVAQNGVFIRTLESGYVGTAKKYWTRVKNLNSESLGQNIYKFGFDSRKGRPYIEFPSDIASIIKSGLSIQYITTSGKEGNVKAKYLTVLESPTSFAINGNEENTISFTDEEGNTGLAISNFSASVNGADPETIDEAYNGFKKTVGTFSTLVTCRDYANAIYNMLDEDDFPLVSNVTASDRRTDINFACKVLSFNEYGTFTITNPISIVIDGSAYTIKPYDLCLYPLNPIYSYSDNGAEQFVKSFQPLGNTNEIETRLEEGKSISHDYLNVYDEENVTYLIKNYLTLNINISTVNKVYSSEQADIIKNVQLALVKNFNARKVDYGYEIPFDTLLKVIQEADNRISSVSLAEPTLTTKYMNGKGAEYALEKTTDLYYKLVAMNVLAGKVQLFNYDSEFNYEFGQMKLNNAQAMKTTDGLKFVKSLASIPYNTIKTGYTLDKNEVIQLIAPSYATTDEYPAYCLFSFWRNGNLYPLSAAIPNGTIYKLQAGEYLYMNYKTETLNITEIYKEGDIIQPVNIVAYNGTDMGLVPTNPDWYVDGSSSAINDDYYRATILKDPSDLGPNGRLIDERFIAKKNVGTEENPVYKYCFNSLTAQESICIKKKKEITKTKPFYAYWIVNNPNNKLFPDGVDEITLMEGEYFFYTDYTFTNLITLGSGTTIKKFNVTAGENNWEARQLDYEELEEKGLLGLRDYWIQLKFTSNGTFTITENTILTLTENDNLTITGLTSAESPAKTTLDNTFSKFNSTSISYQIDGEDAKTLDNFDMALTDGWKIRSRLDINAGRDLAQPILTHQSMIFTKTDDTTYTVSAGSYINLSELTQMPGGDSVDLSQYDFVKQESIYPINVYNYDLHNNLISRDNEGYARLQFSKGQIPSYEYYIPNLGERAVLMIYFVVDTSTDRNAVIRVTAYDATNATTEASPASFMLCSNPTSRTSLDVATNTIYCLDLPVSSNIVKLKFEIISSETEASGVLIVDKVRYIQSSSINPLLDIANEVTLMQKIRALDTNGQFYYTNRTNNDIAINLDTYTKLSSPYVYYDFNHVANRFTISEIDFDSSIISIARSSRR